MTCRAGRTKQQTQTGTYGPVLDEHLYLQNEKQNIRLDGRHQRACVLCMQCMLCVCVHCACRLCSLGSEMNIGGSLNPHRSMSPHQLLRRHHEQTETKNK